MWAGVAIVETVLELGANDEARRRAAAVLHYRIDLLVEIPLLFAILATGWVLTARLPSLTALHLWKLGCGLTAIGLNLFAAVVVILRYRRREDPRALARYGALLRSGGLAVPFAVAAFYLGIRYFKG